MVGRRPSSKLRPPPEEIDIESEDGDDDNQGSDEDEYDGESQMDVDDALSSSRAASESVSVSLNPSSTSTPRPTPQRPSPLKVTLKLGKSRLAASLVASSSSGSIHGTGVTPEPDAWRQRHKRAGDEMEEDELDELENDSRSVQSSSRMTARQAAIASGFDTEHVQLTVTPSKKKKHLNEAELLARRNETAIKRRHQTEKKLEDDKTETINRLLKKQSAGTRRKRALEESQSAASAAAVAAALAQNSDDQQRHTSSTGTVTATGYATASDEGQKKPKVPCFRWISTSRPLRMKVTVQPKEPEGGDDGNIKEKGAATQVPNVRFSFSIPHEFLPAVPTPAAGARPVALDAELGAPGVGDAPSAEGIVTG